MIFVTVGTHEQPFNRLVEFIDELKKNEKIQEKVIIQTGFSTYKPKYCEWSELFSYQEMVQNVQAARIVITHGGPSSFIMALQMGKVPIVAPRQKKFDEHVNDHQMEFSKEVAKRMGNIIVVEDMEQLQNAINQYDKLVNTMTKGIHNNNKIFNENFEKIVAELMKYKI